MLKKVIILAWILLLSACHTVPNNLKPAGSWVFKQVPKNASPVFKKAWMDGCESGLSAMTNSFYRAFYKFKQDQDLRRDPVYYKTWKDTYTFCRHYIYGTIRQANVRMRLPLNNNVFLDNISGGLGVFAEGPLNNLGPGTWGLLLENWGVTGGDSSFFPGISLDFTGDSLIAGDKAGVGLTMDFTPVHSIAPYHSDVSKFYRKQLEVPTLQYNK